MAGIGEANDVVNESLPEELRDRAVALLYEEGVGPRLAALVLANKGRASLAGAVKHFVDRYTAGGF
jgi:hypothetical protein